MSVLIKGMEMPENCKDCRFHGRGFCFLADLKDNGNCPLVEVPPHGRLIDADKLKAHHGVRVGDNYGGIRAIVFKRDIDNAPTIIEAEEADNARK